MAAAAIEAVGAAEALVGVAASAEVAVSEALEGAVPAVAERAEAGKHDQK